MLLDNAIDGCVYLTSPTSSRSICISLSDRQIHTGCFSGTTFWLINKKRIEDIPEWAYWLAQTLNTCTDDYILNNLKQDFNTKFNTK